MKLIITPYLEQLRTWPSLGRHILAQFDDDTIVVYQAYRPSIAEYALKRRQFGGDFSFERMSWIKTNFLWMMYRSAWGTEPGQEVTLAIWLSRQGFSQILQESVSTSFTTLAHADERAWRAALAASDVRLQWDPDHDPAGTPLPRRAIQLGIRGVSLKRFSSEWIRDIEDISEFVREQAVVAASRNHEALIVPMETVFPISDRRLAKTLGMGAEADAEGEI